MKNIALTLAHPAFPIFLMAFYDPQLHAWLDSVTTELPITKELLGRLAPFPFGQVLREEEEEEEGDDAAAALAGIFPDHYDEGASTRRLTNTLREDIGVGATIGYGVAQTVIGVAMFLGVACIYKTNVTDRRKPWNGASIGGDYRLSQGRDFRFSIFDCCSDMQYCLHGWCCCDVRIADTYHGSNVGSYWTYVMVFLLLWVVFQLLATGLAILPYLVDDVDRDIGYAYPFMFYIAQIPFGIWLATQRGKLREAFGGDSNGKCFMDFICYWWCGCCVAIQEARHFDAATSTRVSCCYNFEDLAPQRAVVGLPFGIFGSRK